MSRLLTQWTSFFALACMFCMFFSACGSVTIPGPVGAPPTTNATGTTSGTSTGTTTTTPCAQSLPNGTPLNGTLANLSFPPQTLASAPQQSGGADGQFALATYLACSPSMSVAQVTTFFATTLPQHAWHASSTYPYDGYFAAPCMATNQLCFVRDTTYVEVHALTTTPQPTAVSYQLIVAIPPSPPSCTVADAPDYLAGYYAFLPNTGPSTDPYNAIPLPPLTRIRNLTGVRLTQGTLFVLCAPAAPATIRAFLKKQLTGAGWTLTATDVEHDDYRYNGRATFPLTMHFSAGTTVSISWPN